MTSLKSFCMAFVLVAVWGCIGDGGASSSDQSASLRINQIQFVGSHNSYKKAMSAANMQSLQARNPSAAEALDYNHIDLAAQLDLGVRKREIDVFYDPCSPRFPVGHVQVIDMNTQCEDLQTCLLQARAWSDSNRHHVPIWISFNTKDQSISGLPDPAPFTSQALVEMDGVIEQVLGVRLIRPAEVKGLQWPTVGSARGKFLLILDEQGDKRDAYWQDWQDRPMFTNAPFGHPAAAVMIINDPIEQQAEIRRLVLAGYMVRTRADADTQEARNGSTARREAAFASGAQAISTDYYLPADHFGTGYQVKLAAGVRCNPVNTEKNCAVSER
jgi:hypothetical protein